MAADSSHQRGGDPAKPAPTDSAPVSLILGTAGHIDHGKTALVRALTGRDLDRLPEEKARGITIELGFAPLELSDGMRLGVVDVPGHEKFVRTMVAGASGLDLLMLVVAADEGVMPQTREHLVICELLGIERGLVVLTKSDLVDDEMAELAGEEVRDLLAGGPLAEIQILSASAETGDGIENIRDALEDLIRTAPQRSDDDRPARLFVDRTFTKHGFGTIVTGTWSGRPCRVGESVVLEPGGRKARIRGLERHGESIDITESGARIAVNLQGESKHEIHRGDLLTEPGALLETVMFDASLHWMASKASLAEQISVELLCGTTERRARVAPIGSDPISPGDRAYARIQLDGPPLALLPGDRFVLRGFARDAGIGSTLGGGIVLDIAPPHRRRRDAGLKRDLESLAQNDPAQSLDVRIRRAGLEGVTTQSLAKQTGFSETQLGETLDQLVASRRIVRINSAMSLSEEAAARLKGDLATTLAEFHAREPLLPGMPRASLANSLPENVSRETGVFLLRQLADQGELRIEDELVCASHFESSLDESQTALAERLRVHFRQAALDAPSLRTLADEFGERPDTLREISHFLERQGTLVSTPDDLFFDRDCVLALITQVLGHFDLQAELDTQTLKAFIGTSRRTAMPLMALLDDLQITRREGSLRRLLNRTPRW
ncbi:MAG: selenocysteine-specific translation elongation factor [Myxococcota bacterium]